MEHRLKGLISAIDDKTEHNETHSITPESLTFRQWSEQIYTAKWTAIFINRTQSQYLWHGAVEQLMEDARQDMAIRLLRLSEQPERQNQTVTAAYIVQTFKHVLTDRMRALKGRPRPRKWLRELYGNELAVQLLDLVCLQQLGHGEILEALRDRLNAAQVTEVLSAMSRMRECDRWQTSETSQNAEGYVESPDDDN